MIKFGSEYYKKYYKAHRDIINNGNKRRYCINKNLKLKCSKPVTIETFDPSKAEEYLMLKLSELELL